MPISTDQPVKWELPRDLKRGDYLKDPEFEGRAFVKRVREEETVAIVTANWHGQEISLVYALDRKVAVYGATP